MSESPEGPNAGREGYKDFGGRGFGVWKKYEEMLEKLKEQKEEKEKKDEEKKKRKNRTNLNKNKFL